MGDLDTGPATDLEQDSEESRTIKFVARVVAGTVIAVIAIVGGCSMHGHVYEADNIRAEAAVQAEKTKAAAAEYEADKAKTDAIASMVNSGVNPIAAKCAVNGWMSNDDTCMAIGLAIGKGNER
jgi:hypothetical protein